MHRFIFLIVIIILVGGGYWYVTNNKEKVSDTILQTIENVEESNTVSDSSITTDKVTVIAENLDTPWAIAFLPDGEMLVTQRNGSLCHLDGDGHKIGCPFMYLGGVKEIGEGGLLGITLHPDYPSNHYVYLYYTFQGNGSNTLNRVVRMTYTEGRFEDGMKDEKVIVDAIPGASNHDGGRIKFGPDKMLYIGTGDAQEPSKAQDTNSMAGKILRVTENGDPAPNNPFNNRVYSYGHRNVQGLAWDTNGQLWATEHGPSGASSCCDELNKIESGKNYGWPTIQGTQTKEGMVTPFKSSGETTWAPSGVAYFDGSLYFSGLRGQTLYKAVISGSTSFTEYLKGEYGRFREVVVGPDNMLYVTTSNQDGRGSPKAGDDKILRIDPKNL